MKATGGKDGAGIGSGIGDNETAIVNITGGTVVATGGDATYEGYKPDDIGIGAYYKSDATATY